MTNSRGRNLNPLFQGQASNIWHQFHNIMCQIFCFPTWPPFYNQFRFFLVPRLEIQIKYISPFLKWWPYWKTKQLIHDIFIPYPWKQRIKLLALLLDEKWDIEKFYVSHFEKWVSQPPQIKSSCSLILKFTVMGYSKRVVHFMIASQSARFSSLGLPEKNASESKISLWYIACAEIRMY